MRLAVRGVPKGRASLAFCLAGSPIGQPSYLCRIVFARAPVVGRCFFVSVSELHQYRAASHRCAPYAPALANMARILAKQGRPLQVEYIAWMHSHTHTQT